MKKIILTVTLVTLAFSFTTAQKTAPIKRVEVTAKTIASQPAGKDLVLDLTRSGKVVYNVAADINYSRVRIHTLGGDMPLSDMVRRLGLTGSKFVLGTLIDMSTGEFAPPDGGTFQPPDGGTSPVYCFGGYCMCVGPRDCRDMQKAGLCKGKTTVCGGGKPWGCSCLAKA
jgi:hypothetical protein